MAPGFDQVIADESDRLRAAASVAPGAPVRVPTCPEWSADDLLWHVSEVQHHWADVLEIGGLDHAAIVASRPDRRRPGDRAGLLAASRAATARLSAQLLDAPDDRAVWTWAEDHTVGFVRRRQAHEALIHRVDAELVGGVERAPLDPALAADGVDEALRVMLGGCPPWGTFTPDGRTVDLRAADADRVWTVALGRFTGVEPEGGEAIDEADLSVVGERSGVDGAPGPAEASVGASAADLVCWLWGRPPIGLLQRSGDPSVLAALSDVVGRPIT